MANCDPFAYARSTLCLSHRTAPATLAHHPVRRGWDEQRSLIKLTLVVRDTACSLLEALAGIRSLCSVLQSRKRSHAFRLPNEQARGAHPNSAQLLQRGSTNWALGP